MKSVDTILEFEKTIDAIYGVYLDSISGFRELRKKIVNQQFAALQELKVNDPKNANIEFLDHKAMIYGKGNPNDPKSYEQHRSTQLEFKQRNSEGGLNDLFIGNMALVSIYQYWEDYYRAEIANLLGIQKNDLKEPVMGDIRLIRQSIIHHAGVALPDIKSCEVLKWFQKGDKIFVDKEMFEKVIYEIKKMILQLKDRAQKL